MIVINSISELRMDIKREIKVDETELDLDDINEEDCYFMPDTMGIKQEAIDPLALDHNDIEGNLES